MRIDPTNIVSDNGEFSRMELIIDECPDSLPGCDLQLVLPVPEQERAKAKEQIMAKLEAMATITGTEIPSEIRERVESVEVDATAACSPPWTVSWN